MRTLSAELRIVDEFGSPVPDVTADVSVYCGGTLVQVSDPGPTGDEWVHRGGTLVHSARVTTSEHGIAEVFLHKAITGCYNIEVMDVAEGNLNWAMGTPLNAFRL